MFLQIDSVRLEASSARLSCLFSQMKAGGHVQKLCVRFDDSLSAELLLMMER